MTGDSRTHCNVIKKNGKPCKMKTHKGYPCMYHETNENYHEHLEKIRKEESL